MAQQPSIEPVVVIGVGNEYRHDDGVGPAVISALRSRGLPGALLADSDGEPSGLIELWEGKRLAVVIDAVRGGSEPGRLYRLGVHHPSAARPNAASSHGVGLGEAVDLARVLGRLPRRMLLYAVEAGDTSQGVGLTPAVSAAADQIVHEVEDLVAAVSEVS